LREGTPERPPFGDNANYSSPDASHAVALESCFVTDDRNMLGLSLGDEHAVEGVLVRAREESGANAMLCRYGQRLKTFAFNQARKIRCQVSRRREFPQPDLDGDFPSRSGTNDQRVFGFSNDSSSSSRQRRIIGKPPQQSMRVEECAQLDYSQDVSSLIGRGSKNSGPTCNLPFNDPGWRLPFTSPTGTSRATGFDPRAMITSSPSEAFSISRERFVLAWWMVTILIAAP
jgi:hypothetical protein